LKTNPLRILDSKDPDDRGICHAAPKIDAYLTSQAQDFFAGVTSGLDAAGVAWKRSPALVRGFDYYRHTAFEFITDRLGAQGTVLGGGRYDGLIEHLGGPHTPAVGWAAGIERLAMLLDAPTNDRLEVAVVAQHPDREMDCIALTAKYRMAGFRTEQFVMGSPRKRFDRAKKTEPAILISLDVRDDINNQGVTMLDEGYLQGGDVEAIFNSYIQSKMRL
jgi:histidyl-tRNA synthetase